MESLTGIIHSIQTDIYEKKIVTASSDGIVRVFDNIAEPGVEPCLEQKQELEGSYGACTKAVFINEGEFIASSYFTGKLVLWKREAGAYVMATMKDVFSGTIYDIDALYNEDTIVVYCACSDGLLRIVKISPGYTITEEEFVAHRFGATSVSASRSHVVSGGLDNSVVLWVNNEEKVRLRDHKGFIRDVKISKDNVFGFLCFASCSEDGFVNIYTEIGGDLKKQIIEIGEPVYSLSWSRTGFSLSVGYGTNGFKCFTPGSDGTFKEVELTKCDN